MPPSCAPNMAIDLKANPSPVADGNELAYHITVRNDTEGPVSGVVVSSPIPAGSTYIAGSASDKGKVQDGVVKFLQVKMKAGETINHSFKVKVNKGQGATVLFSDDMESGPGKWKASHLLGLDDWALSVKKDYSGKTAWFAVDPDRFSNQLLATDKPVLLSENALLRFWHDFATEDTYDGGVVEISTDGGLTWIGLGSKMIQVRLQRQHPAGQRLYGGGTGLHRQQRGLHSDGGGPEQLCRQKRVDPLPDGF